tara:strand:- start:2904 stop:3191 length:288 start_codon:yes stop_codon:yes gene_type:complete
MALKKKYKREVSELVSALVKDGRTTAVLEIKVIETSKMKGYLIYECSYIDNGKIKVVNIIAVDISDALIKLEPFLNAGIPERTTDYILGNCQWNV